MDDLTRAECRQESATCRGERRREGKGGCGESASEFLNQVELSVTAGSISSVSVASALTIKSLRFYERVKRQVTRLHPRATRSDLAGRRKINYSAVNSTCTVSGVSISCNCNYRIN